MGKVLGYILVAIIVSGLIFWNIRTERQASRDRFVRDSTAATIFREQATRDSIRTLVRDSVERVNACLRAANQILARRADSLRTVVATSDSSLRSVLDSIPQVYRAQIEATLDAHQKLEANYVGQIVADSQEIRGLNRIIAAQDSAVAEHIKNEARLEGLRAKAEAAARPSFVRRVKSALPFVGIAVLLTKLL